MDRRLSTNCPVRSGNSEEISSRLVSEKGSGSDAGDSNGTEATRNASASAARKGRTLQGMRRGATFLTSHTASRSILSWRRYAHKREAGGPLEECARSWAVSVDRRCLSPTWRSIRLAAVCRLVQSAMPWRRSRKQTKPARARSGQATRMNQNEESEKARKVKSAKPRAKTVPTP